jgi:hypothetical protein
VLYQRLAYYTCSGSVGSPQKKSAGNFWNNKQPQKQLTQILIFGKQAQLVEFAVQKQKLNSANQLYALKFTG